MRRKRRLSVSRVKHSLRAQEPDPEPEPGHHGLRSLKEEKAAIAPVPLPKPAFGFGRKGESPDPGGHPPGPNLGR